MSKNGHVLKCNLLILDSADDCKRRITMFFKKSKQNDVIMMNSSTENEYFLHIDKKMAPQPTRSQNGHITFDLIRYKIAKLNKLKLDK